MKNTKIEWADHTLNFWWGCTKVSEACRFCYAEAIDKLFGGRHDGGKRHWGPNAPRWIRFERATEELTDIVRAARKSGKRPRVFINSMSDTFEDNSAVDVIRCHLLVMLAVFPQVDFMLLTKRPENVKRMVPMAWLCGLWPKNVWVGTTIEDQENADVRVQHLRGIPAAVRFVSCEPLLSLVQIQHALEQEPKIHWVIAGGESGPHARPCDPDWVRSLREQCLASGVPFHFKQWGGVRKHETGRTLDDQIWHEFPVTP